MCFGENQLSPSLIGLSPLPSSHSSGFQPTTVRSSTACYGGFNLLKGRLRRLRVYGHVTSHAIHNLCPFAYGPEGLKLHVTSILRRNNCKAPHTIINGPIS